MAAVVYVVMAMVLEMAVVVAVVVRGVRAVVVVMLVAVVLVVAAVVEEVAVIVATSHHTTRLKLPTSISNNPTKNVGHNAIHAACTGLRHLLLPPRKATAAIALQP